MSGAAAVSGESFVAFAVWSAAAGIQGISRTRIDGERQLAGSPVDCCLYGIDEDGYLVSTLLGRQILHPATGAPVKLTA